RRRRRAQAVRHPLRHVARRHDVPVRPRRQGADRTTVTRIARPERSPHRAQLPLSKGGDRVAATWRPGTPRYRLRPADDFQPMRPEREYSIVTQRLARFALKPPTNGARRRVPLTGKPLHTRSPHTRPARPSARLTAFATRIARPRTPRSNPVGSSASTSRCRWSACTLKWSTRNRWVLAAASAA